MIALRRSPLLALLLVTLTVGGCGGKPSPTIEWTLGEKNGKAALTLNPGTPNATTLLFESMSVTWPPEYVRTTGTFQVQGEGTSSGPIQVKADEISLSQAYGNGITTIRVNYCAFKIIDNGAKLEFLNETFPLSGSAKTIVVARDSTARVQQ